MKQKLLKTLALGLLLTGGVNGAWAQTNLLSATNLSVSAKQSNTELAEDNKVLSEGTLTLNSLAASDLTLTLTFNAISVDASKCFVILETSQGIFNTSGAFKARNITLDGNKFDSGNNADKSTTTYTKDAVTHDVILMSPMGKNTAKISETSTQMLAYYAGKIDGSMSLTSIGFNIPVSTTGDVTIYRIGLYDIAEIESLYGNPAMRFKSSNSHSLYLEFGGTANQVLVNSNTITLTRDESAVLIKSFGSLPNTCTLVSLRGLTLSDVETAKPFNKDLMTNLANVTKVLISTDSYKYFPTANRNVFVLGNRYYDYKDGENPTVLRDGINSVDAPKQDGTTSRYFSYTRNFVEGYSSCVLPFTLDISKVNDNLSFYTFTSHTDGNISFSEVTGTSIECNTPFIVKAAESGLYILTNVTTDNHWNEGKSNGSYQGYKYYETSASNNVCFVGSLKEEAPMGSGNAYASNTCYGISSDGTKFLKMAADTKTTYYRAFIADKRTAGAPALTLSFDNGNGTTDIVQLKDVHGLTQEDGAVYNLQGVRMTGSNLPAGIYVKNGKKYVVK